MSNEFSEFRFLPALREKDGVGVDVDDTHTNQFIIRVERTS